MKTSRKIKKLGGFSIPVFLFAALILIWILKPTILSSYLTSRLGVSVSVGSMSISSKQMEIGRFSIRNPYTYKGAYALKADRISVDYRLKPLLSTPSEIDLIALQGIELVVEFKRGLGGENNWTQILNKLAAMRPHREKEVLIHRLTLDDMTVKIRGVGTQDITKTVSHIELTEIDSKEGFPTRELIIQIFGGAGIQEYIQNLLNPANTIKKIFTNPFKIGKGPQKSEGLMLEKTSGV